MDLREHEEGLRVAQEPRRRHRQVDQRPFRRPSAIINLLVAGVKKLGEVIRAGSKAWENAKLSAKSVAESNVAEKLEALREGDGRSQARLNAKDKVVAAIEGCPGPDGDAAIRRSPPCRCPASSPRLRRFRSSCRPKGTRKRQRKWAGSADRGSARMGPARRLPLADREGPCRLAVLRPRLHDGEHGRYQADGADQAGLRRDGRRRLATGQGFRGRARSRGAGDLGRGEGAPDGIPAQPRHGRLRLEARRGGRAHAPAVADEELGLPGKFLEDRAKGPAGEEEGRGRWRTGYRAFSRSSSHRETGSEAVGWLEDGDRSRPGRLAVEGEDYTARRSTRSSGSSEPRRLSARHQPGPRVAPGAGDEVEKHRTDRQGEDEIFHTKQIAALNEMRGRASRARGSR